MMNLAIDVHYREGLAKAVGVIFNWNDCIPVEVITRYFTNVEEYIPGQFYKRELPCILEVIKQIDLDAIDNIIIDGHVYIDNDYSYGLGGHLWLALDKKKSIIGVAKRAFHDTDNVSIPIYRGESKIPLYISGIGIDVYTASKLIKNMHGKFRIPTLLKYLDTLTKED